MNCVRCSLSIEPERLEVLPDTLVCSACARNGAQQKSRPKGILNFSHKTGGVIQILSEDAFKERRRYEPYGKNTGRGSGVHRMTRSTSRY
jgi:hypothetical protein